MKKRRIRNKNKSIFNLNEHDEHKVLMLATGLVFGMALACFVFRIYTYVGLAALSIGLVLVLVERREEKLKYRN